MEVHWRVLPSRVQRAYSRGWSDTGLSQQPSFQCAPPVACLITALDTLLCWFMLLPVCALSETGELGSVVQPTP